MTKAASLQRCAIYTRVSTEFGLEQEFNSLDAQREASEAYIKSQAHEGWRLASGHFDDGGYSGGTMNRPGLHKLLAAIREKRIDIVVVYKVDRLTRSLSDFANLVELFDAHCVSFVSVTQPFNTTTSMGRLTLNVLLSFAQFEREVTGERIRDKIAAAKRKGIWMGGPVPLGYDVVDRKLVANSEEAERVRDIFSSYLEVQSLDHLLANLRSRNIVTKRTKQKSGKVRGGLPFAKHSLAHLLKNRIYVGELVHRGEYVLAEHTGIVSAEQFQAVQALLKQHSHNRRKLDLGPEFLLTGKIFDDRGNRMSPTATRRRNAHYRYYVSAACTQGRRQEAGSVWRVSAPEIEGVVMKALGDSSPLAPHRGFEKIVVRTTSLEIHRIDVAPDERVVKVDWQPTPRVSQKGVLFDAGENYLAGRSGRAIEAVAIARQWLQQILSGKLGSLEELARREKITLRSARMRLSLAFVDPAIVRALIDDSHTTHRTVDLARLPITWQR